MPLSQLMDIDYKLSLKSHIPKAFDHLNANHIAMKFENISKDEKILDATIELTREMKDN